MKPVALRHKIAFQAGVCPNSVSRVYAGLASYKTHERVASAAALLGAPPPRHRRPPSILDRTNGAD